jgi:precorrin-6Y C5,15-methyltransferase (decarboxylating)
VSAGGQQARWLAIVGIGEDGVEGLSPAARALIANAKLVIGGKRHLALADGLPSGERKAWPSPIAESIPAILAHRGEPVAVLASGDPYCFGVGAMLSAHVPVKETICVPAPSSLSLACARLGWALDDVATVSLCGRPIETLAPSLQPKRRVLVLSADATTPAAVARYLGTRGFERSSLHVLEALGGPRERIRATTADRFGINDVEALNLIAIEVEASPGARIIPLACGLPDEMFEHDGQITKREIRAVTLSSLSPRAGELLWDIGCGSGSIAIEWLLRHQSNRAIGIERDPLRAARAARNAAELGVPRLEVVTGEALNAVDALPAPDAVFIGGGGEPSLLDKAYAALRPGGRIVANAITLDTDRAILAAQSRFGGTLTRLSVERLDAVGGKQAFRPAMTVTQWSATKP